jgi:predicted heme/steroid binding protein
MNLRSVLVLGSVLVFAGAVFAADQQASKTVSTPATEKTSAPAPAASAASVPAAPAKDSLLSFTPSALAAFNGQNGAKAYVAVDGVVYDVTGVKAWAGGKHHGNNAGKDVSAAIKKSPHGNGVLKKLKVVGKLIAEPVAPANEKAPATTPAPAQAPAAK